MYCAYKPQASILSESRCGLAPQGQGWCLNESWTYGWTYDWTYILSWELHTRADCLPNECEQCISGPRANVVTLRSIQLNRHESVSRTSLSTLLRSSYNVASLLYSTAHYPRHKGVGYLTDCSSNPDSRSSLVVDWDGQSKPGRRCALLVARQAGLCSSVGLPRRSMSGEGDVHFVSLQGHLSTPTDLVLEPARELLQGRRREEGRPRQYRNRYCAALGAGF